MKFYPDLHIHSKYYRATPQNFDLENLYLRAQYKRNYVVGTVELFKEGERDQIEQQLALF